MGIYGFSGVASGINLMFAFVKHIHGDQVAQGISIWMGYSRHLDPNNDPFGITVAQESV